MPAAIVPAWKRLGLKLKYVNETAPEGPKTRIVDAVPNGQDQIIVDSLKQKNNDFPQPPSKKRKVEQNEKSSTVGDHSAPTVKKKFSAGPKEQPQGKKLKKQVSFSSDTKTLDEPKTSQLTQSSQPNDEKTAKKSKPKAKSKQKKQKSQVQKPNLALDYLNQYYTARSSWKFNKNRETWLLKHVFSTTEVPREYDVPLARYVSGLQGNNARQRLKLECEKRLSKDTEVSKDTDDQVSDVNKDEELRKQFLRDLQSDQGQAPITSVPQEASSERDQYNSWIQRQTRARLILWSLEPLRLSDPSSDSTIPTTKIKDKKRKNRTAVIEYDSSSSSSSSSESDSESGSGSSGSIGDETSSSDDSSTT